MCVNINLGRTYQALRNTVDKTHHNWYDQQTQQTTRTRIRRLTTCSSPKISLDATNTENTKAITAHVIDRKLVGDLHGADVDGGRGQAKVLEP